MATLNYGRMTMGSCMLVSFLFFTDCYMTKGGILKRVKQKKSCKSFDLQDSVAEREGFESKLTPLVTI